MLTLIAAWHAVDAAIFACNVSMEIAAFSRSMPSRISVSSFSASGASHARGNGLNRHAPRAHRLDFETVGASSSAIFSKIDHLPRRKLQNHRHQHALALDFSGAARFQVLLEEHAFVRHVLIHDPQTFGVHRNDEARS